MITPLLSQVSLLKVASSALGIGAHQAMKVAEALYLAGYLSYPRTESTAYPPGTDLGAPLREQAADAQWGDLAQQLLARGAHAGAPPPRGGVDAGDHPPITPVLGAGSGVPGGSDGRRIYELVTRQFLASLCPDAVLRVGGVELIAGGEHFRLSSLELVEEGWCAAPPPQPRGGNPACPRAQAATTRAQAATPCPW